MPNRKIDRGETVDLTLVLRNAGAGIGNTSGRLVSQTPFIDVLDGDGVFGPAGTGETTASLVDGFRIRAMDDAPVEVPLYCDLFLSGSGYSDTILIPIIVGDSMNLPVGPDSYGYRIYDWTDSCYQEMPVYDWFELRGVGEVLTIGDDETRWLELPADFGFWRYYGVNYRNVSICANGWIAADTTSRCDFTNVELPYSGAPPNIIAFLWDDLAPSRYGTILYYYDRQAHRFIVQFDSVSYFGMPDRWEKVQIQLFDTAVAGSNQDNPIAIQFQTVNEFRSVTVGLQNRDGSAGLTYLWNGNYPRTAAPLMPARALFIKPGVTTGLAESPGAMFVDRPLRVAPNPFRRKMVLELNGVPGISVEARVYQPDGRLVKRITPERSRVVRYFWDGRDERGRMVAPGLYFIVVLDGTGQFQPAKVIFSP